MQDIDELLPVAAHGVRAAGRCADTSTLTPMRRHIGWVGWVGGSYVGVDEWLVGGREP